jgi:hypothetical protein
VNPSFGPWSTAISTGAHPELNTFWKRRLAMLPMLGQTASRVRRRTVLLLGALAVAGLAIPTLKWTGHDPFGSPVAHGAGGHGDPGGDSAAAPAAPRGAKPGAAADARGTSRPAEYLPRPTEEEEKFLETLGKKIDVDFLDMPLEECIHRLGEQTGLPFWLDKPALTDEGVALDQPITLKLTKRRVEAVLNLLLTPVQLTTVFENDVLVLTTAAKAGEKLITRTYPVADLCPDMNAAAGDQAPQANAKEGPDTGPLIKRNSLSNLMNTIESTVQPDSWEALSGPGAMSPYRQSGSLVIRQTLQVHREILELLRDLREAKGKLGSEKQ